MTNKCRPTHAHSERIIISSTGPLPVKQTIRGVGTNACLTGLDETENIVVAPPLLLLRPHSMYAVRASSPVSTTNVAKNDLASWQKVDALTLSSVPIHSDKRASNNDTTEKEGVDWIKKCSTRRHLGRNLSGVFG
jgi:hypothetical protein